MKKACKRWLILADDHVVDVEYVSEKKAHEKAFQYSYGCEYQDEPCWPKMKVIEETIE